MPINQNYPFNPARWPFFYGWMILVWGTLGMLMSIPGQTMGVSVFTESLLTNLQISRNELSTVYMAGTIGSTFLLPWVGRLYDKAGVRIIALYTSISLGFVLIYLSQIDRIIRFFDQQPPIALTLLLVFIGFLLLRFTGQGTLTMISRNMMMKWFEKRRGLATGISNVFVSLGFSIAPWILNSLINAYDWRMTWIILAVVIGFIFPFVVYVFFRDNPEESGLAPDGDYTMSARKQKYYFPVKRDFTLREALGSYPFWIFTLILAMQGLYITGFTFHVVSIFKEAGLSESMAIGVFPPIAYIAVGVTLSTSYLADMIPLKYLLWFKGTGAMIGTLGLVYLGRWDIAYYLLIIGTGMMSGLFAVLSSVTWPRFYGKRNLGAISSQSIRVVVLGTAVGPVLFSSSLSYFGSYTFSAWTCFVLFFLITFGGIWANNPQKYL